MRQPQSSNPLLTIVIPVYNCEKYIRQTIESTCYCIQHYPKEMIEILIVDDASEDQSLFIARAAEKSEKNVIRVLTQKHAGVSMARNLGIQQSKGTYVIFLDADDAFEFSGLSCMIEKIKNQEYDFVFGSYQTYDETLQKVIKSYPLRPYIGDYFINYICNKTFLRIGSFAVSRAFLLDKHILFSVGCRFGEDQGFIARCLHNARNVCALSCYLTKYRISSTSVLKNVALTRFDYIKEMSGLLDLVNLQDNERNAVCEKVLEAYLDTASILMRNQLYNEFIQYKLSRRTNDIVQEFDLRLVTQRRIRWQITLLRTSPKLYRAILEVRWMLKKNLGGVT